MERPAPFPSRWLAVVPGLLTFACVAVAPPSGASGRRGAAVQADGGAVGGPSAAATCDTACPVLDCADGMHPAPLSGECCPTVCEPDDCSLVDCPPLECASGTHTAKPNSSCCAVCSPNAPAAAGETCTQGQAGYDSYFSQITASLGAMNCLEDGDCRLIVIDNPCSHGCGTAVAARQALTLKSDLDDYAATHCAACDTGGDSCPATERVAFCTGGVCSSH